MVAKEWNSLTHWDKILITTAIRLHKALIFPMMDDLSTIIRPQSEAEKNRTIIISEKVTSFWRSLGLRSVNLQEGYSIKGPSHYLNPVNTGSQ
jgi:hypothetical protein